MTNEEAIKAIKCNYPPENYTRLREALDMAIEALEKQMRNCGNCLRADRIPNYHMVYCRVHNSVTSDDNCCRYWSDEDDE